MTRWVWMVIALMIAVTAAMQWQHRAQEAGARESQAAAMGTDPKNAPAPAVVEIKPPPGEPPEEVLLRFQKEEYDEINRAGGMKVTVSASGRQIVLMPKLYGGRKDYCRAVPREPEGSYECGLDLMVTLREGDDKPGQHGERQFVHWDGVAGEWKRGLVRDRSHSRP